MNGFNAYLGEGTEKVGKVETLASATTAQIPGLRQEIVDFIASYTPRLAPALPQMSTEDLQKLARKVIGGVHYNKVFKQLPEYLEAQWISISEKLGSKSGAYSAMVPSITEFGAAYGVKGNIADTVKKEIEGHAKTIDDLVKGKSSKISALAEEVADEEVARMGDDITKREKEDYIEIIKETLVKNQKYSAFKNIILGHYQGKVENFVKTHEGEMVSYLKSIADGVYKEAPRNLMRNYEKFATLGGVVDGINKNVAKDVAAMQKQMREYN